MSNQEQPSTKRKYPAIYEKVVPIALGIIVLAITILVIIILIVAFRGVSGSG
jgi:hypothetical protein